MHFSGFTPRALDATCGQGIGMLINESRNIDMFVKDYYATEVNVVL